MNTFIVKDFAQRVNTSTDVSRSLRERYDACNFSDDVNDFVNAPTCSNCPYCYKCSHTWVSKSEVHY